MLPAGKHLGARGETMLAELEALFSGGGSGLVISRAPWVPYCQHGCCAAAGRVPASWRRAKTVLLTNFPSHDFEAAELGPRPRAAFQRDVHNRLVARHVASTPRGDGSEVVGAHVGKAEATRTTLADGEHPSGSEHDKEMKPSGHQSGDGVVTVTWLLAHGINQRRLANESGLVDALRMHIAHRHPRWRLVAIETDGSIPYADEAAAISRSDVLISLFGSALHGCRYLARGSIVLELHGALANDASQHWQYWNVCAWLYGMRWAALPLVDQPRHHRNDAPTAYVSSAALLRFFDRAVAGEWEGLIREYEHDRGANPDPDRRRAASAGEWRHARTVRDKNGGTSLPPQYATRRVRVGGGDLADAPLPHGHVYVQR